MAVNTIVKLQMRMYCPIYGISSLLSSIELFAIRLHGYPYSLGSE